MTITPAPVPSTPISELIDFCSTLRQETNKIGFDLDLSFTERREGAEALMGRFMTLAERVCAAYANRTESQYIYERVQRLRDSVSALMQLTKQDYHGPQRADENAKAVHWVHAVNGVDAARLELDTLRGVSPSEPNMRSSVATGTGSCDGSTRRLGLHLGDVLARLNLQRADREARIARLTVKAAERCGRRGWAPFPPSEAHAPASVAQMVYRVVYVGPQIEAQRPTPWGYAVSELGKRDPLFFKEQLLCAYCTHVNFHALRKPRPELMKIATAVAELDNAGFTEDLIRGIRTKCRTADVAELDLECEHATVAATTKELRSASGLQSLHPEPLVIARSVTARSEAACDVATTGNAEGGTPVQAPGAQKRKPRTKREVAEPLIAKRLMDRPHDTATEVARKVGCSVGVVAESRAWKLNQRRLKAAKQAGIDPVAVRLNEDAVNAVGGDRMRQTHDHRQQADRITDEVDAREKALFRQIGEYQEGHPDATPEQVAAAVGCTAGEVEFRQITLERLADEQAESDLEDTDVEDDTTRRGKRRSWVEKRI